MCRDSVQPHVVTSLLTSRPIITTKAPLYHNSHIRDHNRSNHTIMNGCSLAYLHICLCSCLHVESLDRLIACIFAYLLAWTFVHLDPVAGTKLMSWGFQWCSFVKELRMQIPYSTELVANIRVWQSQIVSCFIHSNVGDKFVFERNVWDRVPRRNSLVVT